LKFYG
jgi:hypothetical protein